MVPSGSQFGQIWSMPSGGNFGQVWVEFHLVASGANLVWMPSGCYIGKIRLGHHLVASSRKFDQNAIWWPVWAHWSKDNLILSIIWVFPSCYNSLTLLLLTVYMCWSHFPTCAGFWQHGINLEHGSFGQQSIVMSTVHGLLKQFWGRKWN